jgi:hypothetical protein
MNLGVGRSNRSGRALFRYKADIAFPAHPVRGIPMPLKSVAVIAELVRRCAIAVLAFVPAFAGLAFGQSIAPKKETMRDVGKCVGVISAIGDTLSVSKFGFFGNEESKLPIDTWRIDDLVFSKISAVLGARSNLKRVSVPKRAFAGSQSVLQRCG